MVMSSFTSPPYVHLFLFVVGTTFFMSSVNGTDHIVGANKGWNPGVNYSLWANNQTIFVGDYISFRYKRSMHNVVEVNKKGYENCTTEGSLGNWTNGKDFIQFKKPGRYYFICALGGCSDGMKVSVVVHPLSPPTSASITQHSAESAKTSGSMASEATLGWLSLGLLMGFVCSV